MTPLILLLRSFYVSDFIEKNDLIILSFIIIVVLFSFIVLHLHRSKTKQAKHFKTVQELSEQTAQLQTAFIANITHELRTPLNGIIGFVNVLASTDDLSKEERRSLMDEVNKNGRFLTDMINDLLDYSKIESNSLEYKDEEIDVNAVVGDMVQLQNMHLRESKVKVEFVENIPQFRIKIDRTRFMQVLRQLIENALKYTEEGSIKVGYRHTGDGNFIYFYVADTGCGMDEEERRNIFHRFVKVNHNIRGIGIGLAIIKAIIEHYGGGIGVESRKGEGSTFYFTLPSQIEYQEYGKF
ncbi:MAG: HAMP domain-containing histidine kinase [Prevotellaceae bacterium]|jgi:signal transduction histidine kinase|nr:HAMP domain-containing histidine kinase [Prevotellaceae bacterium]